LRFVREILVPSAISGKFGVRTVTALTSICKVLLDYDALQKLDSRVRRLEEQQSVVKKN